MANASRIFCVPSTGNIYITIFLDTFFLCSIWLLLWLRFSPFLSPLLCWTNEKLICDPHPQWSGSEEICNFRTQTMIFRMRLSMQWITESNLFLNKCGVSYLMNAGLINVVCYSNRWLIRMHEEEKYYWYFDLVRSFDQNRSDKVGTMRMVDLTIAGSAPLQHPRPSFEDRTGL